MSRGELTGYDSGEDSAWWAQATHALRSFLSVPDAADFILADFMRWSKYYHNLQSPCMPGLWGLLFREAYRQGQIFCIGSTKAQQGYTVRRWSNIRGRAKKTPSYDWAVKEGHRFVAKRLENV